MHFQSDKYIFLKSHYKLKMPFLRLIANNLYKLPRPCLKHKSPLPDRSVWRQWGFNYMRDLARFILFINWSKKMGVHIANFGVWSYKLPCKSGKCYQDKNERLMRSFGIVVCTCNRITVEKNLLMCLFFFNLRYGLSLIKLVYAT